MCIITVKPKGIELPKEYILRRNMANNPHGSGFVVATKDKKQHIYKGYFKFEDFYLDLLTYVKVDDVCIIHNRIATSGKMDLANCHPFPITRDIAKMKMGNLITNLPVLAHNGILSGYGNKKWSDTKAFIGEILADRVIRENLGNRAIRQLITDAIQGDRLAIMHDGQTLLLGEFINDDGILYSNKSFKSYSTYLGFDKDEDIYTYGKEYRGYKTEPYYDVNEGKYKGDCEFCDEYSDDLVCTEDGFMCQGCYEYMSKDSRHQDEEASEAGYRKLMEEEEERESKTNKLIRLAKEKWNNENKNKL